MFVGFHNGVNYWNSFLYTGGSIRPWEGPTAGVIKWSRSKNMDVKVVQEVRWTPERQQAYLNLLGLHSSPCHGFMAHVCTTFPHFLLLSGVTFGSDPQMLSTWTCVALDRSQNLWISSKRPAALRNVCLKWSWENPKHVPSFASLVFQYLL